MTEFVVVTYKTNEVCSTWSSDASTFVTDKNLSVHAAFHGMTVCANRGGVGRQLMHLHVATAATGEVLDINGARVNEVCHKTFVSMLIDGDGVRLVSGLVWGNLGASIHLVFYACA